MEWDLGMPSLQSFIHPLIVDKHILCTNPVLSYMNNKDETDDVLFPTDL